MNSRTENESNASTEKVHSGLFEQQQRQRQAYKQNKKHRITTISPPPTSVEVQTNRKETSTTARKQKATATEPFFALHPPHSNFITLRSTRWRCTSHSDWKCRINATA